MQRDYGKVPSSLWTEPRFAGMTDDSQKLLLYLKTCTHGTIAGVFRLPDGYIGDDLNWPSERVAKAFAELSRNRFANRCETTKWVFMQDHFAENKLANPNQIKAAVKCALQIPDQCAWKRDYVRLCGPMLGLELPSDPEPSVNPSATVAESVSVSVAVIEPVAAAVAEATTEDIAACAAASFALTSDSPSGLEKVRPKKTRKADGGFDAALIELPDWLDRELWLSWVAERKGRSKAISDLGAREQLKALDEYRAAGHTPERVIGHAIASGNQGLFPPPIVRSAVAPTRGPRQAQSFVDIDYTEAAP